MLETSAWPRVSLSVQDDLHLDPKNVRLETASSQVEADIIEDLFDNENAFALVDAIAKIGYLTHELPIVVKRRGKYIVVEGNRRLAALKAIQNPKIVPAYQARVAALAQSMGQARDRLSKVEVLVAPNQAQADQLIAALHTSNPRRPWSPARQAAFFQAQIDAGRTYSQLLARYPTIDVADFVLRARLVNRLKSAVADQPELADFIGSSEWRKGFSALTRIFESKDFREITGAVLDSKGRLEIDLTDDEFDAVASLIVQGMQDSTINTRTLNRVTSPRFLQLVSEMRAAVASAAADGASSGSKDLAKPTASADALVSKGAKGDSGSGKPPRGTKPAKKARISVLPIGNVTVPDSYGEPLKTHFSELSIINIQRTPNAAFLMLRAILEKSIKAYADAKSVDIGKTQHNTNGRAQLHNCLTWAEEYWSKNGKADLVDPVKRVQGGRLSEYTGSKAALNALNHNYKFHVEPEDVERAWQSIDPLLRELLKP